MDGRLESSVKEYQKYKILTLRKGLCPPCSPTLCAPLLSASSYFTSSGLPGMLKGRKREKYNPPSVSPPPSRTLYLFLTHPSLPLSVNARAKSFYHHFQSLSELLSAGALLPVPGSPSPTNSLRFSVHSPLPALKDQFCARACMGAGKTQR